MQFHPQMATGNATAFVSCCFCLLMLQGGSLYLYTAVMALEITNVLKIGVKNPESSSLQQTQAPFDPNCFCKAS